MNVVPLRTPMTAEDCPRCSLPLLLLLAAGLATIFFVSSVDWEVSTREQYTVEAEDAEELFADGKTSRRIAYAGLALLGAALWIWPGGRRWNCEDPAGWCWAVYIGLCLSSVLWSDAPWLTAKRAAILLLATAGVLGVVRRLSLRDLIDVSLGASCALVGIGLLVEMGLGTFRPWLSEYRFAGTVHPNTQASHCALMLLAAYFGFRTSKRRKPLYGMLFVVAAACLLLTRSRTSLTGCLIGLSIAAFLGTTTNRKVLLAIGVPFLLGTGLLVALIGGTDVAGSAQRAAQLGRGADADVAQLNGRLPLWMSLLPFMAQRPWLGYGYHGFWTPERIGEISLEQEWTVPNAHAAFLDVLLSVGWVGGFCFALAVLLTLRRTVVCFLDSRCPLPGFALALLVYALSASLFESGFTQPDSLDSFLAACVAGCVILQAPRPLGSRQAFPGMSLDRLATGVAT